MESKADIVGSGAVEPHIVADVSWLKTMCHFLDVKIETLEDSLLIAGLSQEDENQPKSDGQCFLHSFPINNAKLVGGLDHFFPIYWE